MASIEELTGLRGRVALITGGAGHIGSAIAHALAECGASVGILDLDKVRCSEVAESLRAQDVSAAGWPVDLEDEARLREIPQEVVESLGGLDILVHCAALVGTSALKGWGVPFADQDADTWRKALEVNLTAPFILTQAAAPFLRATGHGSVVTIGSIYGVTGPDWRLYEHAPNMGNPAAYAASKGGLLQFTRWLSTSLSPDVRANMISIGGVARGQHQDFVAQYVARTPLKRMATEDDIKGAAVFLASDMSRYVTGQNIMVDGGWTAW